MERRSAGPRPRPGPMTVRRSAWRSPLVIVTGFGAVAVMVVAIAALLMTSNPATTGPSVSIVQPPLTGIVQYADGEALGRADAPGRPRGVRRLPVPVVRAVRARDAARPRTDVCRRGPAPDRGTRHRVPRQDDARRVARCGCGGRLRRASRQVLDVRRLPRLEPVGRERGGVQSRETRGHGGARRSRTDSVPGVPRRSADPRRHPGADVAGVRGRDRQSRRRSSSTASASTCRWPSWLDRSSRRRSTRPRPRERPDPARPGTTDPRDPPRPHPRWRSTSPDC